jgi:hypothetical protein
VVSVQTAVRIGFEIAGGKVRGQTDDCEWSVIA